jgi:hypothetical protein
MRTLLLITALLVVGCGASPRPVLLCPEALKGSTRDWDTLRDSLFTLKGEYWLTDAAGRPIQAYRYKHEHVPVLESPVMPEDQSKQHPAHISSPIIFKAPANEVVLHLVREGKETTIPLRSAALERHGKFDVLYIK